VVVTDGAKELSSFYATLLTTTEFNISIYHSNCATHHNWHLIVHENYVEIVDIVEDHAHRQVTIFSRFCRNLALL
jgi:hypothetical protein